MNEKVTPPNSIFEAVLDLTQDDMMLLMNQHSAYRLARLQSALLAWSAETGKLFETGDVYLGIESCWNAMISVLDMRSMNLQRKLLGPTDSVRYRDFIEDLINEVSVPRSSEVINITQIFDPDLKYIMSWMFMMCQEEGEGTGYYWVVIDGDWNYSILHDIRSVRSMAEVAARGAYIFAIYAAGGKYPMVMSGTSYPEVV